MKNSIFTLFFILLSSFNGCLTQVSNPVCVGCVVGPDSQNADQFNNLDATLSQSTEAPFQLNNDFPNNSPQTPPHNNFGNPQVLPGRQGGRPIINYFGVDPPPGHVPNADPNGPIVNYFPASVLTDQNGQNQGSIYNYYGNGPPQSPEQNNRPTIQSNFGGDSVGDYNAGPLESQPQFGSNCQCVGGTCNNCNFGK